MENTSADTDTGYTIYVHDGRAHIDELLAATLYVIACGPAKEIVRLCAAEADEGATAVFNPGESVFIDCGGRHDPTLGLFDHHQNRELPSAAKLVFDHFFGDLQATDLEKWVSWVSLIDTKGPQQFEMDAEMKERHRLAAMPLGILLKAFERQPTQTVATFEVGLRDVIAFEKLIAPAKEWLNSHSTVVHHTGLNLLQLTEPPPAELSRAVNSVQDDLIETHDIAAIYSYDVHQEGVRKLFRTDPGHLKLNFTQADPNEVLFNHNNGFLMKFRPKDDEEWLTLIAQAVVGE